MRQTSVAGVCDQLRLQQACSPGPCRGPGPGFTHYESGSGSGFYQACPGPGPDFTNAPYGNKSKCKGEYSHTQRRVCFRIIFIFLASDIYDKLKSLQNSRLLLVTD